MPRYSTMIPRTCETCGKPIAATECRIANGRGRFCSQQCLWKSRAFNVRPVAERFWDRVDTSGDCWLWQGGCFRTGYGAFSRDGKPQLAHRVAYQLTHGPLSPDVILRHTCDNRKCVNPAHLLPGSHQDNSNDMIERGRQAKGQMIPIARLTESAVQDIRRKRDAGASLAELADEYSISEGNVSMIANRKAWKHVV